MRTRSVFPTFPYNMKRAYLLRTMWDNVGQKKRTPKTLRKPWKTSISCWANKKRPPDPNTVIQKWSKTLLKQTKSAVGPRFGINLAAAPPSRAHVDLQGNPYKTNRKQAFPMSAACVAPCATVPRRSKNTVKRKTL